MNDEITIVSASTFSNQAKAEEYKVLSHHFRGDKIHSGSYHMDELLKIVNDLKPRMITIISADMHGRTIVSSLEYFLSRKFKLVIYVIYELSSNHRGAVISSTIIIRMQKYV